jgi:hypothetical protein
MAKFIRLVNHILVLTVIRKVEDDDNPINREWPDDGYYYLNQLAEVLDASKSID